MLGSFTILASGVLAISPNSAKSSLILRLGITLSGNWDTILPARDMSLVSTDTPAESVKALTIGRNEYVAKAGASSVKV